MTEKCKCCSGDGSIPTGVHCYSEGRYEFTLDGKTKTCFGCDGTGIPVRLHEELGINPGKTR